MVDLTRGVRTTAAVLMVVEAAAATTDTLLLPLSRQSEDVQ
jgi:hypothetical protein